MKVLSNSARESTFLEVTIPPHSVALMDTEVLLCKDLVSGYRENKSRKRLEDSIVTSLWLIKNFMASKEIVHMQKQQLGWMIEIKNKLHK